MAIKINKSEETVSGGDVLGGFKVYNSDAYEAIVKMVYVGKSAKGASFLGIHLLLDGTNEYRENIYFTNAQGDNFYVDKRDGKKKELPGYQTCNEMCLMTTGFSLEDQETEEKVASLYDSEQGKEVNQSVDALVNVMGQPIIVGLLAEKTFKQKKNDATGLYEDTDETVVRNQINKFFHAETQGTATEYQKDAKLGTFFEAWIAKNKSDEPIDRTKGKTPKNSNGAPGKPGGGTPPNGKPTSSLFNKG